MKPHKSCYFNTCTVILKLTAVLVLSVLGPFGCAKQRQQGLTVDLKEKDASVRLDLNRATASEIAELPGIGPKLAARIVEFRDRFGPFREPEDVILVRGMSDARFRRIRELISAR